MAKKNPRGIYEKVPGSGIWWIRYTDENKKLRREKVGRKGAAIQLVEKRRTQVRQGEKLPENFRSVVKVADLAAAILRDYAVNKRKSSDSLERRLNKHILPFLGSLPADSLGTDDIDEYVDLRRDEDASNATINRELAVLKRMYTLAYRSKPRRVQEVPAFPRLKESAPREGFIEDEQYEKLQSHTEELWLKAILAVGYSFGFRKSEVLNLKVRQIATSADMIRLEAGSTKNDDARAVKMTSEVKTYILACIRGKGPNDSVFTRGNNEPVLDFRGAWYALCQRAGLGRFVKTEGGKDHWEGLIFHDLRRSAVRVMIRRGIPEVVARKISGHKTPSVFHRYNIVSEGDIVDAAAKIESGRKRSSSESGIPERRTDTKTDTDLMIVNQPIGTVDLNSLVTMA